MCLPPHVLSRLESFPRQQIQDSESVSSLRRTQMPAPVPVQQQQELQQEQEQALPRRGILSTGEACRLRPRA